jgi:hypothetical protein
MLLLPRLTALAAGAATCTVSRADTTLLLLLLLLLLQLMLALACVLLGCGPHPIRGAVWVRSLEAGGATPL